MAIPPEPIEEVIKDATSVVICEVAAVDPPPPMPALEDDVGDVDDVDDSSDEVLAEQDAVLVVQSVLFGKLVAGARVQVKKPAGEYLLREGFAGPFILDERHRPALILGRYGPDSYSLPNIRRALATRR